MGNSPPFLDLHVLQQECVTASPSGMVIHSWGCLLCCRGGCFTFSFNVSPGYPHEPPKVKCRTKVRAAQPFIPWFAFIASPPVSSHSGAALSQ